MNRDLERLIPMAGVVVDEGSPSSISSQASSSSGKECHFIADSHHILFHVVVYSFCGWILLPSLCSFWNRYLRLVFLAYLNFIFLHSYLLQVL